MKYFTNQKQLDDFLKKRMKIAVDRLTERIKAQLQDNITKYTYNYDKKGNKFYEPTYEFRDKAWVQEAAKESSKAIIGWVLYDYKQMRKPIHNPVSKTDFMSWKDGWLDYDYEGYRREAQKNYIHGNYSEGHRIDRRKRLAKILNVDGENGSKDFRAKERKPFFDITIDWIKQNWRPLVRDAFLEAGIKLDSITGPVTGEFDINDIF